MPNVSFHNLYFVTGFDKVAVHTDSQFMISCMCDWLPGWKRNNWRKKDGETVKNKEDLINLDKASQGIVVKWVRRRQGVVYSCNVCDLDKT